MVGAAENREAKPDGAAESSPGPVNGAGQNAPAIPAKQKPQVTTIDLPTEIDDAAIGAGGKTLIVRLKDLGKLAAIDVKSGKIAGYVTLEDPSDVFAAGAEKLVTVNRQSRLARCYSLTDLRQEAQGMIPGELPVVGAGMGASSRGPLLVVCAGGNEMPVLAIEPTTLQPSSFQVQTQRFSSVRGQPSIRVNVSADGSVFCLWNGNLLSFARTRATFAGGDSTKPPASSLSGPYACPDDTGERIYVGNRLFSDRAERVGNDDFPKDVQAIPAIGGPFYLTLSFGNRQGAPTHTPTPGPIPSSPVGPGVNVYMVNESKPVASLPIEDFPLLNRRDGTAQQSDAIGWRLFFLPAARVIVELPTSNNVLVLHHLDLNEQLRRVFSGGPVVVSRPPRMVYVGETLRYQIQALSDNGKPVFKLSSGPEGMVVSSSGLVEWTPGPRQQAPCNITAVIFVGDSGQFRQHTFTVTVQPAADVVASADEGPSPEVLKGDKARGNLQLKLPAAFEDVCVGGNGRYLVFNFLALKKVAVFDVVAAKIIGYVPIEGHCLIAAGMDKFVVLHLKGAAIERFDLRTQKPEAKQTLSLRYEAARVGMGCASQGPVMVVAGRQFTPTQVAMLSLDSLTSAIQEEPQLRPMQVDLTSRVSASADGRVFSILASKGACTLGFTGRELAPLWDIAYDPYWVVPDETGERLHTRFGIQGDRFRTAFDPNRPNPGQDECSCLPAIHGPLYLWLKPTREGFQASLCLSNTEKPLACLQNFPLPRVDLSQFSARAMQRLDRQVFLIPNFKVLVLLSWDRSQVVLCPFDLAEELGRSPDNYLAVVSSPPRTATPGKTLEYPLGVRSKAGKLKYRLDAGPNGMQISSTGLVRWQVKDPPDVAEASVRITVTDGLGQSAQHSFELTTSGKSAPDKRQREWQLTKVDDHRLMVSQEEFVLTPGLRYESMLLLKDQHLAVLAADGMTIRKTHELGAKYVRIAERAGYYVALTTAENTAVIDLLDKKTLATIRRIRLTLGWPVDLAIHPTRPVSYVAVQLFHSTDSHLFVTVDEASGKFHSSPGERWVHVDAAGQRLVTGGHQHIGLNDLDENGSPRRTQTPAIRVPVGPSLGLRLAPDGMRATLLGQGASNPEAINVDVPEDPQVEYAMEGKPTRDLAYHPVLSLVACLGPTGPRLFDRETGKPQPDLLKSAAAELKEATIRRLWFSADGKGLLLEMDAPQGGRCLYRAALDFSSKDVERIGRRLPNLASLGRELLADAGSIPGEGTVPLKDMDALKGGRGREMSPTDVAREFTDAVVLVQSGNRFGTGFVVGASGYVVTWSQCVGEKPGVSVAYRAKIDGKIVMKWAKAKILRVDHRRELALLKVEGIPLLPAVRLGIGATVERGERVTIIGHPGVSPGPDQAGFYYTMAEGLVSEPQRRMQRRVLIQTSAAVTPGFRGAPLFNANGLVIGIAVSRVETEQAGFAEPAGELGALLATMVKATGPDAALQRQWIVAEGKQEMTAEYLGVRDGAVQMRRADGTETSVPLAKLSPQDRAFVRLLRPDLAGQ